MRALLIATLALPLAVAAIPASAEKGDREKEIVITADHGEGDDVNKVTTMRGNVIVTQGTMRIAADRLELREDAKKNKLYVATGSPVTFRQKRDQADEYIDGQAQRAEFDDRSNMLKLFQRARVTSGSNQLTGEFISYDMNKEVAEVTGAPPGQAVPPNSRVKVIITPPKKTAEEGKKGGDAEAKKPPPLELKADPGKAQ
jgi:lipopolysaccharide export system protein LptA